MENSIGIYIAWRNIIFFIHEEIGFSDWNEEGRNWRKIPEKIRIKCHQKREKDRFPDEPFRYLTLVDMMNIIDKNWKDFYKFFEKSFGDKKEFLTRFKRVNWIRNIVMHPIKTYPTLNDFVFVREFYIDTCQALRDITDVYNNIEF